MENIVSKTLVVMLAIILVTVGVTFYWFQIRPSQIRKECASKSKTLTGNIILEKSYSDCLKSNGLEK
ncbi:MAG: hypothetical protein A2599_00930 [Candidatus Staskawiczbacteria bacterium RIFOXYD1_FULL_39_28]|nr:MAG: hypothetical protein A2599_00930 [Candidatus Staskawiczbacteria bacterium RIFOXYD1_FULL_39_28]